MLLLSLNLVKFSRHQTQSSDYRCILQPCLIYDNVSLIKGANVLHSYYINYLVVLEVSGSECIATQPIFMFLANIVLQLFSHRRGFSVQ